jgi:hypothetical protein
MITGTTTFLRELLLTAKTTMMMAANQRHYFAAVDERSVQIITPTEVKEVPGLPRLPTMTNERSGKGPSTTPS